MTGSEQALYSVPRAILTCMIYIQSLILLTDPDQPFVPLFLIHLPKEALSARLFESSGLIG